MRSFTPILAAIMMVTFAVNAHAAERFWFDDIGVEMGITGVFQGTSGNEPDDETTDQFDYAYSADIAFIGRIANGQSLNIVLEAGGGEAVANNFDARATPNYDAADSEHGLDVAQAYYEGEFADGALVLSFGRMDAHSLTDGNEFAGDECSQFLNGLFVRSVGVIFAEHSNYYVPTLAITVQPMDLISLIFTYSHDTGENFFEESHMWVEAGLHPTFGDMSANLRVGYAMHDIPHTEVGSGAETTNSGMINVSFDLTFMEGTGVFARYAMQDDTIAENEVVQAISAGVSIGGALWGRPDDGIGAAYGMLTLNENHTSADGETVIEVYYRMQAFDHLALSADLQMFSGLEQEAAPDVTVFGLRLQSDF